MPFVEEEVCRVIEIGEVGFVYKRELEEEVGRGKSSLRLQIMDICIRFGFVNVNGDGSLSFSCDVRILLLRLE